MRRWRSFTVSRPPGATSKGRKGLALLSCCASMCVIVCGTPGTGQCGQGGGDVTCDLSSISQSFVFLLHIHCITSGLHYRPGAAEGRVRSRTEQWRVLAKCPLRCAHDMQIHRGTHASGRTILFFHIISARPSKQPRMVRTFLKVYIWSLVPIFCFCKNK
jgi:hypothetical protein